MNIIFFGDILRAKKGIPFNQRWIEHLLEPLLTLSLNVKMKQLELPELEDIFTQIYLALGYNPEELENFAWCEIYNITPNEKVLEIIAKYFKGNFAIAFEIHPIIQKAFDILQIPYIKLMNHPIRYMDDIFFGITSNVPSIHNKILKYKTDEFFYRQHASILKAEAAVNEFTKKLRIKENSCIFFAQTNVDCSLMKDDKILNFFDFKDEFLKDIEPYEHTYFKLHPYAKNQEVIDFIKTLDNVTILYGNEINFYDLISSDNIKKCFAISSGSLYEARYFGKEVKYYHKQPFMFVTDYPDGNYPIADTFVPIYKTFWQPGFWADILSDFFEPKKDIPVVTENYSNKLRRILKMTWGYNDVDSVNIYHEHNWHNHEIKNLWGDVNRLKHAKRNKLVKFLSLFIFGKSARHKFRKKYMK